MNPEDERKRIRERERGSEAKRIFDSTVWQESYESLAEAYVSAMLSENTSDEDTLELKRRILALSKIKSELSTVMETGHLAEIQLERAKHATDRDDLRKRRRASR